MTFLWSEALWLLSAVPLLSAAYVYVLRHRVKASARYAGMTWYRPSAALMHAVKNRLPACLLLIALIAMVIAIARPIATITLPATSCHRLPPLSRVKNWRCRSLTASWACERQTRAPSALRAATETAIHLVGGGGPGRGAVDDRTDFAVGQNIAGTNDHTDT